MRNTAVVLMTAYGTIPEAVEAVRSGVADYLTKPLESPAFLRQLVSRVVGERAQAADPAGEFLSRDPQTLEMLALLDRAAATDTTIRATGKHRRQADVDDQEERDSRRDRTEGTSAATIASGAGPTTCSASAVNRSPWDLLR